MVAKTIEIEPDRERAQLIHQVKEPPVFLMLERKRFRLGRDTAIEGHEASTYAPQRVIEGMEEAPGAFPPQEATNWSQNVNRWRRKGIGSPETR